MTKGRSCCICILRNCQHERFSVTNLRFCFVSLYLFADAEEEERKEGAYNGDVNIDNSAQYEEQEEVAEYDEEDDEVRAVLTAVLLFSPG